VHHLLGRYDLEIADKFQVGSHLVRTRCATHGQRREVVVVGSKQLVLLPRREELDRAKRRATLLKTGVDPVELLRLPLELAHFAFDGAHLGWDAWLQLLQCALVLRLDGLADALFVTRNTLGKRPERAESAVDHRAAGIQQRVGSKGLAQARFIRIADGE
jgi:hypothetical protein